MHLTRPQATVPVGSAIAVLMPMRLPLLSSSTPPLQQQQSMAAAAPAAGQQQNPKQFSGAVTMPVSDE
jgi:hypothetical protein